MIFDHLKDMNLSTTYLRNSLISHLYILDPAYFFSLALYLLMMADCLLLSVLS